MDEFEMNVINRLASGMTQKEISEDLKLKGITPNSISLIEKRLKAMRTFYECNTNFKLALILKSKGLI